MAGATILVIDNAANLLNDLAYQLKESGHIVHTCATAKDALGTALSLKLDLAILGVGSLDLDGFALASQLRADAGTSTLPLMFLGDRPADVHLREARNLGAAAYLEKPFRMETFLALVDEILSGQRDRRSP